MKTDELQNIKSAIKELKNNRSFTTQLKKNIINRYAADIAQLDTSIYNSQLIEILINRRQCEINKLYDDMGCDITIHFIYVDGSECIVSGEEIVAGINPPLQHIVYACYSDAYTQYDTETGCLDDMFQHGENAEEMEMYFSNIEIKFNTKWGKAHK